MTLTNLKSLAVTSSHSTATQLISVTGTCVNEGQLEDL